MARILLVEDDADVRAVIELALAGDGHSVATAADCGTAIAALGAGGLDLVVTDVRLPDGSGRRLAPIAAALQVPVLFITGSPRQMTALEAEGVRLLRKPFHLHELLDAVAAALRRSAPPGDAAPEAHGRGVDSSFSSAASSPM